MSGCVHEWPVVANCNPIRIGKYGEPAGLWRTFNGTHGNGSPEVPDATWNWSAFGEWYEHSYGQWAYQGFQQCIGFWLMASNFAESIGRYDSYNMDRTGRYGARAARTAPFKDDPSAPLELDPLPDMRGADIAIFDLTGRFNNTNDKPLMVELRTTLPDACFPNGPARMFTAAPKAVTPFRIPMALTIQNATGAVRRVNWLPVRILDSDGHLLATREVRLLTDKPWLVPPRTSAGSLDGGEAIVLVKNTTTRPQSLTIDLPTPPGITMSASNRLISVAAGADAKASFPIPRQAQFSNWRFVTDPYSEWVSPMPYRAALTNGAALHGETAVKLKGQSHWWAGSKNVTAKVVMGADHSTDLDEQFEDAGVGAKSQYSDVFKAEAPPKDWQALSHGIPLGGGGKGAGWARAVLPGDIVTDFGPGRNGLSVVPGSELLLAATRIESPREQDVVINVRHAHGFKWVLDYEWRLWINGELVGMTRHSHANVEVLTKPVRLRKSGNTLLVECQLNSLIPARPGMFRFQFLDATSKKPLEDLIFDIDKR